MADVCNARKPGSVLRCEKPKGHRSFHACVSNDGIEREWPSHKMDKRARMNNTSPDQEYRTGVLHGIMAERIGIRIQTFGRFICEGPCSRSWDDVEVAMRDCAPAHVEPRRKRPTSKAEIFASSDAPGNILVACVPCNDKIDVRSK